MNGRTFEILAKWIAKENGVTIEFQAGDVVPHSDIKRKHIVLPAFVKSERAWTALQYLMHEAAHLIHTKEIPEKLVNDAFLHQVLNVMEDIRIDKRTSIYPISMTSMNLETNMKSKNVK